MIYIQLEHNQLNPKPAATRRRTLSAALLLACGTVWVAGHQTACAQSLFQPRARPAPAPAATPGDQPSPAVVQPPAGQPAQPGQNDKPAAPATAPADAKAPAAGSGTPGSAPGNGTGSDVVMAPTSGTAGSGPRSIREMSLMAVIPPEPKLHKKHDKIELIVNESSLSTSQQKLDANKKFDFTAQLSQFPSLAAMIGDLELRNGIGAVPPKVGVNSDDKFKGDGKYERSDRMTARISGLVTDVKPNGMLLVEARESIQQDEETKTMVISGLCDPKDITNGNTVQSSQLANLNIRVEHSGPTKDAATKGLIPRFFETLFNF